MRRLVSALLLFVGLAACSPLVFVAPAQAHAGLAGSNPTDGAKLGAPPDVVTLTFTEEVSAPAYVVVTGPSGDKITTGKPKIYGQVVRQAIRADGPGRYRVAFRVISVDGHPVTEQLSFTVKGKATASASPSPASATPGSESVSPSATPGDDASEAAPQLSWVQRHPLHSAIGLGLVLLALALLFISRRSNG